MGGCLHILQSSSPGLIGNPGHWNCWGRGANTISYWWRWAKGKFGSWLLKVVILQVCSTGSYGSPSHCKRWTRPVLPWDTKRWHSVCSCLQSLRAAAEWTGLHVKLWCYCRSHLKMTNWSLMLQEWILNFWNYQWELFNATYLFLRFHSTIGNYHSCKDYILQLSNQLNVITFYIIMSIGFSILLKNTISVIKSINELKCQCFNYSSFICFYLRVQKMTLPWHVTNDGISCVILKNHWPY